MTAANETKPLASAAPVRNVPVLMLAVFRVIGQVFFQENALTGVLFLLGIALSSPRMAAGGLVGAVIGTATAQLLKFKESELLAGI
jgi:urea transporter